MSNTEAFQTDDQHTRRVGQPKNEAFRYPRLQNAENQIRLLNIQPGMQEIVCALHIFDTANLPKYSAISYTWGDAQPTNAIVVNNTRIQVQQNCWFALSQRRRSQSNDAWTWIGSVCIDQEHTDEKSFQVRMIGDIFRNADRVLVSLDDTDDHGRCIATHVRRVAALRKRYPSEGDARTWARLWWRKWSEATGPTGMSKLAVAIDNISFHRYWNRLWIFQELKLGKNKVIMFGMHEIDWNAVDTLLFMLIEAENEEAPCSPAMVIGSPMWYMMDLTRDDILQYVNDSLDFVDEKDCADPRDRIYGVCKAVSWGEGRKPPTFDYGKSSLQLAIEMAGIPETYAPDKYEALVKEHFHVSVLLRALRLSGNFLTTEVKQLLASRRIFPSQHPHEAFSSAGICVCTLAYLPNIALQQRIKASQTWLVPKTETRESSVVPTGSSEPSQCHLNNSGGLCEGVDVDMSIERLRTRSGEEMQASYSVDVQANDIVVRTPIITGEIIHPQAGLVLRKSCNTKIFQIVGYATSWDRLDREHALSPSPFLGSPNHLHLFLDAEDLVIFVALFKAIDETSSSQNKFTEVHEILKHLESAICRKRFSSFAIQGPRTKAPIDVPPICVACGGWLRGEDKEAHFEQENSRNRI